MLTRFFKKKSSHFSETFTSFCTPSLMSLSSFTVSLYKKKQQFFTGMYKFLYNHFFIRRVLITPKDLRLLQGQKLPHALHLQLQEGLILLKQQVWILLQNTKAI